MVGLILTSIRTQCSLIWRFLGIFQKGFIRYAHAGIILLVLWQLMTSSGIALRAQGLEGEAGHFFLWLHIAGGFTTLVLGVMLVAASLTRRGLKSFFPYLWGDVTVLVDDIKKSLSFKLLPPHPKGLASTVQGLGMGALLLVTFSGALWFWLWLNHSAYLRDARDLHDAMAALVTLYLLGHGGMALLHFAAWQRHLPK